MAPRKKERGRLAAGPHRRGRTTRAGVAALALAAVLLLVACGNEESSSEGGASFAAEASHVHGLGINPADQSLFIATHGGLFRSAADSDSPSRIGEAGYDLMGFTVAGPDRFLASGHPPLAAADSPHLGLVESSDGGESWEEVSLGGRADFHVLRYSGGSIYGYNGLDGRLMLSTDEGGSWQVGIDWRKVFPAWFRSLAKSASAEEFASAVVATVDAFEEHARATHVATARKLATAAQRRALDAWMTATPTRRR